MRRRRSRYDDRPRTFSTVLIGSVLVVAWILTSAAPAQAYITRAETRHYAWQKVLKTHLRPTYDVTLNSCWVVEGGHGSCNFTALRISAKGVQRCTGRLDVTKVEYEKPRGYAPTPPPTFTTVLAGEITCGVPS